jgi:peptidoglycan/xylan/chitin deacetylase (PgdA/CDA1 family)
MTGRPSANTRRLHLEFGGFLYDRDSLNDELPYWITMGATRHLVIPYSFETNDNRFDQNLGFSTGENFARYMIDYFEVMYEEGTAHPKLMSLALHDRLTGRPGRITGLVPRPHHRPRPRLDLHRSPNRRALAPRASRIRTSGPRSALSG